MTESSEMEAVLEAILFVANDPVPRAKLLEVFEEREREAAEAALERLLERYRQREGGGILADEVAGGVRLVTRPDLHAYLRRFFEISGTNKLSMAALETLSIIAYRQPVTGPEIQELRGVSPSGVIKTLLERRLIRVAGRKEVVGKPFLYATTREFLMHFGLKSLKELPPLEQLEELFGGDAEGAGEGTGRDQEEEILRQVAELEEAEAEADDESEGETEETAAEATDEEAEEETEVEAEVEAGEPEAETPVEAELEEGVAVEQGAGPSPLEPGEPATSAPEPGEGAPVVSEPEVQQREGVAELVAAVEAEVEP